jgi:hypothetical protein
VVELANECLTRVLSQNCQPWFKHDFRTLCMKENIFILLDIFLYLCVEKITGSGSSTIICSNLKQFGQVIVRDHLWDPLDQIKVGLSNHLSG